MNVDLPDQLPGEPEERLFEVVIRFCRNLEVLEVFLPVEGNRTSLHFPFLISSIEMGNVDVNEFKNEP